MPRPFHEEVIRFNIGLAYRVFLAEQSDLTPHRKDYEDVAVLKDSSGDYYSLLPESAVNISDCIHITTTKGSSYTFEMAQDGEWETMSVLEVSKISDVIPFKLRGDRVLYMNMDTEIDQVDMHIVIPFESYDDFDQLYLPMGADELIIETVSEFLLGTTPRHYANDGSERTD
jgi:hypothetical protein